MRIFCKTRLTLSLLLLIIGFAGARADEGDILFLRFQGRFLLLDSLIHGSHPALQTDKPLSSSLEIDDEAYRRHVDSLVGLETQARINTMKNVTGLSLQGQAYARLDDGFGLDEEDALSRYKEKIQAEVRWNFLQSSLINRKGKRREIELQGEIERLGFERENLRRLVGLQKEEFRQHYDSLLCGVLSHRLRNLDVLSQAQYYLLGQGNVSSDYLLDILNEKSEAERLHATISREYPPSSDLSNPHGAVIEVDSAALNAYITENERRTSTLELRAQLLEQQAANTTYWSTLNISPFVRYSYYMRPERSNSSNIDAGISFIIPLSAETSRKRRALEAERQTLELERRHTINQIHDEVRLSLGEIVRLNSSIRGEMQRLRNLKAFLALRRTAYENRIGEYNYIARMKEYNAYLLCYERLLGFVYQRDCLLASLQYYLPDKSILDFCRLMDLDMKSLPATSGIIANIQP